MPTYGDEKVREMSRIYSRVSPGAGEKRSDSRRRRRAVNRATKDAVREAREIVAVGGSSAKNTMHVSFGLNEGYDLGDAVLFKGTGGWWKRSHANRNQRWADSRFSIGSPDHNTAAVKAAVVGGYAKYRFPVWQTGPFDLSPGLPPARRFSEERVRHRHDDDCRTRALHRILSLGFHRAFNIFCKSGGRLASSPGRMLDAPGRPGNSCIRRHTVGPIGPCYRLLAGVSDIHTFLAYCYRGLVDESELRAVDPALVDAFVDYVREQRYISCEP